MSCVYWAPKSRIRMRSCSPERACENSTALLDAVIWRFLGYLHIVDVRFAHAGGADLDELRARAQLLDGRAAGIAHARPDAAHELLDDAERAALVRHPTLDALGNELVHVHLGVLEVAVRRAFLHRAERS